ncbi:MAG: alanine--tRNA ligase [Acidobacteriota bacterium]|nr:alanine--tRNA ligase [Acidobacteriota bacterium]
MTTTKWTSAEVRERFLKFFEERGHRRIPSSSLIPAEDPTLLFTNAGMNQFKDVFTGREKRDYARAASSQKCVRAGGKHNDLDNVGYTGRHQTFFEMLGNFSFGDYFKKDGIAYAWELMTSVETGYGLAPERLWATVYTDDDEAAKLWEAYLPKERILRFGEKENFWSMGETGPCGPCSELHYYQGDDPADPAKNRPELVNGEGDTTMEVWNLVFMQFDRAATGTMTPLPRPSVDTGAGLERITAILQGANNNFDTDLFRPIIENIERLTGKTYAGRMAVDDAPFRVVADHARAATMLIADGVRPSNEGRGYVLRRIIRRALRYASRLGVDFSAPFLSELVPAVHRIFEKVYFFPERAGAQEASRAIASTLRDEEVRFAKTMSEGAGRVGEEIERVRRRGETALTGESVFRFYDTYGIPLDLIEEIAGDEGVSVDRVGFDQLLEGQRASSRASARFDASDGAVFGRMSLPEGHSEFRGYPELDFTSLKDAAVVGLARDGAPVEALAAGESGDAVTDRTVFYPEGGGQVADQGRWTWPDGEGEVEDVRRPVPNVIAHRVRVIRGRLTPGARVAMEIPEWTRRRTQANHTGTHLLHAALRQVLGGGARQMGSLVAPDRLRFDYAIATPPTPEQIAEIERIVNEAVLRDEPVSKEVMAMEDARGKGADMFFGEKYGERVRVVSVPGVSVELCGGCHVNRTGEIGAFKIVSDRGLAAGVRRLEAVTSLGAVELLQQDERTLAEISAAAQAPREGLVSRWQEREDRLRALEREVASLKMKLASGEGGGAAAEATDVDGVRVLTRIAAGLSIPELRNLSDTLRSRLKSGIVVVGTAKDGKTSVVAAVTPDLSARISASRLAARIGKALGGSGGGKADLAQAGGKDEALLAGALKEAEAAVREILAESVTPA